jgi:antitoxin component YwqK of YwqJK toxin-antitoxin module
MTIIGYYKDYKCVVTISTDNYTTVSKNVINPELALYKTTDYKILNKEDILENEIIYNNYRSPRIAFFYITKELAIFDKFLEYEEYKLFPLGYSGMYREYHENGILYKEFFHRNGIIDGEFKTYYYNGNPQIICNYVNGKKCGKYIEYKINGEIYGEIYEK